MKIRDPGRVGVPTPYPAIRWRMPGCGRFRTHRSHPHPKPVEEVFLAGLLPPACKRNRVSSPVPRSRRNHKESRAASRRWRHPVTCRPGCSDDATIVRIDRRGSAPDRQQARAAGIPGEAGGASSAHRHVRSVLRRPGHPDLGAGRVRQDDVGVPVARRRPFAAGRLAVARPLDNDFERFERYVAAALARVEEDCFSKTEEMLSARALPPPQVLAESMVLEIEGARRRTTLVLDDYGVAG